MVARPHRVGHDHLALHDPARAVDPATIKARRLGFAADATHAVAAPEDALPCWADEPQLFDPVGACALDRTASGVPALLSEDDLDSDQRWAAFDTWPPGCGLRGCPDRDPAWWIARTMDEAEPSPFLDSSPRDALTWLRARQPSLTSMGG